MYQLYCVIIKIHRDLKTKKSRYLIINSSKATGSNSESQSENFPNRIYLFLRIAVGSVADKASSRAGSNDEWTKKVFRSRSPAGLCTVAILSLSLSLSLGTVARAKSSSSAFTFRGGDFRWQWYQLQLLRRAVTRRRRSLSTRLGSK